MNIITVENLSKKYLISHQKKMPYTTLRDVMAEKFKGVGKNLAHLFSPKTSNLTLTANKEEFWALKDVSFEVKEGEVVGIIGRNGAGKSTLLKILSRITEPTEGEIKIRGRVASLLEVGTGFHPELTGRENIYLNGAILGMKKEEIKRKFDEMVAFAEVEKFIDTPVKRYSSGMYVRLAFAVAAHLEPEILIIDEVLAVGDAQFQKKCLGKMEEVSREGRTVLFVSHQMQAIEQLCSRAILIKNGSIEMDDLSKKVIEHYLSGSLFETRAIPLMERTDREGSGEYRFADVCFTNSEGEKTNGFQTGEPAYIHTLVVPEGPQKKMTAYASLCVRDCSGVRLFTLASSLKNIEIEFDGTTELCWKIDKFPLLEEDFRCDLYIGGMGGNDPIDYIFDAFVLPVLPADYWGTGRIQHKGLDKIFVDFSLVCKEVHKIA